MSQAELLPNPLTDIAVRMSKRIGYLLALAALFVGSAWFVGFPVPGLILLLIGLTFLCLAFTVSGLAAYHHRQQKTLFHTIQRFVGKDAAASFATDADGMIQYQNDAAIAEFGDQVGATLASAVKTRRRPRVRPVRTLFCGADMCACPCTLTATADFFGGWKILVNAGRVGELANISACQ